VLTCLCAGHAQMIPGALTDGRDQILCAAFKALSIALSSGGEGFIAQCMQNLRDTDGAEVNTTPLLDEVRVTTY
jgi:hypothetical protein